MWDFCGVFRQRNKPLKGEKLKQEAETTYGYSVCDMSSCSGWKYTDLRLHVCAQYELNSPWACASLCLSVC